MSKRAVYEVTVEGTNISPALRPVLNSMTVVDKAGAHSDSATLDIDDTDGRVILPKIGAGVTIALGWAGVAPREVFAGTVDAVSSMGGRDGRTLTISAKGADLTGGAKRPQARHFDNATAGEIITAAGRAAGLSAFDIDPAVGNVLRPYFAMDAESFISAAERLARDIGAHFRVSGGRVILSRRGGDYAAEVAAVWGVNLHRWSLTPASGRGRVAAVRVRHFDRASGKTEAAEAETGLAAGGYHVPAHLAADGADASTKAKAGAAASRAAAGGGTIVIEGDPAAIPDGLCRLSGARPGIDGLYRIDTVTHTYSRGAGFVTALDVKEPQGAAGQDSRAGEDLDVEQ